MSHGASLLRRSRKGLRDCEWTRRSSAVVLEVMASQRTPRGYDSPFQRSDWPDPSKERLVDER